MDARMKVALLLRAFKRRGESQVLDSYSKLLCNVPIEVQDEAIDLWTEGLLSGVAAVRRRTHQSDDLEDEPPYLDEDDIDYDIDLPKTLDIPQSKED